MTAAVTSVLPAPRAAVQAITDEVVALRRDLHQHAELSNEETRTQSVIVRRLRDLGIEDIRAVAGTGVTGLVRGAKPGPHLLWRADMDGLPLKEETGLPFASEDPIWIFPNSSIEKFKDLLNATDLPEAQKEILLKTTAVEPAVNTFPACMTTD